MRSVHTWTCALLGAAFVTLSAPQVWTALKLGKLGPAVPFASTDRDIEGLSGIQNGSERIRQTLAALPSRKKLIILYPDGDAPAAYFASMISYLSWPRETAWIQVDSPDAFEDVRRLDPRTFAALLFCRVPPPAFVPLGTQWAPELIFVPSPAAEGDAP